MYKLTSFTVSIIIAFMLFSFTTLRVASNPKLPFVLLKTSSTKISWKKDVHDFGEIPQGNPVTTDFVFTNNGDLPILISDVVTSCGCTARDFPKEPIAAGKSSRIKVTYNAANKGTFSKTITVKSNDETETKVLTIKGAVK
jgi:hypothetical protein